MVDTGARRSTSNGNVAGSSYARRARKQKMLDVYGDGIHVMCRRCWSAVLTFTTLTVDRIIPGCEGGTYRWENVQPACSPCNTKHGSELGNARRAAKRGLDHGPMVTP